MAAPDHLDTLFTEALAAIEATSLRAPEKAYEAVRRWPQRIEALRGGGTPLTAAYAELLLRTNELRWSALKLRMLVDGEARFAALKARAAAGLAALRQVSSGGLASAH
jgi:hypothetical protein